MTIAKNPSEPLDFAGAIELMQHTGSSYGGGLSNHGPMALEALVSIGADGYISAFVASYSPRLEPAAASADAAPSTWRAWLAARLPALVGNVGEYAGHGLLRAAHATRALERAEAAGAATDVLRVELASAVGYWEAGTGALPAPIALTGDLDGARWLDALPRLDPGERVDGLLTVTLGRAAVLPGFMSAVARLDGGAAPGDILDALALASADRYLVNDGLAGFTLLHGVTVSNMARELLPYLDDRGAAQLVAAVAAFVGAAVAGFDDGDVQTGDLSTFHNLASSAAATLDDHTIKFADACLSVADRTGSTTPIDALRHRIQETS